MGLFKYIKVAFLNHWNLLALGGGLAFGVISGPFAPVVIPLVLAAEIAYLGFLGTHPRFQRYVDAQEAKATRGEGTISPELVMRRLLASLPEGLVRRFEGLRLRCMELRQLAQEIRDPHQLGTPRPLEELQLQGLDRLLWIYLRLLFTQYSLERFQEKTSAAQIQADIANLEKRLEDLPASTTDEQKLKLRKIIEDNLETSRQRLANCMRARDNYELVQLEIDRLENKIRSLTELAVNRQEPDFIAGQVDQVVTGMVQTERTMSELQSLMGLEPMEEQIPEMLRRETIPTKQ